MFFSHLATRPIDEVLCVYVCVCILCILHVIYMYTACHIVLILDIHTSMFNFIIFCNESVIEHRICMFLSRPNSINQKACTKKCANFQMLPFYKRN